MINFNKNISSNVLSKKHIGAALISTVLFTTGCATTNIPAGYGEDYSPGGKFSEIDENWRRLEPPVSYVNTGQGLFVSEPKALPSNIGSKKITTHFASDMKMTDLSGLLKPLGISLIIGDSDLAEKSIPMFDYDGTLGNFLNAISVSTGAAFTWVDGDILMAEALSSYMIQLPQNEALLESVKSEITELGASNVVISKNTGIVSYSVEPRKQDLISDFLERNAINSALISLQVAIISVSMDKANSSGFDWAEFNMGFGNQSSSHGSLGSNFSDAVNGVGVSGTGMGVNFSKGDFSISAVLNYLSTYGNTETEQSVLTKTISGTKVKISSGQEIPYIDSIGVSSLSDSSSSSSTVGTTDVETLEVGLELELSPMFEAKSGLVTVEVDLSISSLLAWIELSAGDQIGTLTQPSTQRQTFTDIVRMKAGDSALIGGVNYYTLSDNRQAPSMLERSNVASSSKKMQRNAMFVMLRPTVTVYGDYKGE